MKRNNLITKLAAALALFVAPASPADAQTAPASDNPASPSVEKRDEVVELNPFTVVADSDVGYQAANTTSGSRLQAGSYIRPKPKQASGKKKRSPG